MSLHIAETEKQFDDLLSGAGSSLCIVDFHATWCGPCHAIAPHYEKLARQYPSAAFIKVDTDKVKTVATRYRITAMPSFVFIRNGLEIDRLRGANPSALTKLVEKYSGPAPEGGWPTSGGQTLGGESAGDTTFGGRGFGGVNPLLVAALIFFLGPWLWRKLTGAE